METTLIGAGNFTLDILILEDNKEHQRNFHQILATTHIKYNLLESLQELSYWVKQEETARIYLIDGYFPPMEGKPPAWLCSEVTDIIRKYRPETKIIVHSSDTRTAEKVLQGKNVSVISKKEITKEWLESLL